MSARGFLRPSLLAGFAALLCSTIVGCQALPGEEAGGEEESAIIGGVASGPEDDAVVLLETVRGDSIYSCTGTVVAPNVVLTAVHCIADTTEDLKVRAFRDASTISVHVGPRRNPKTPTVGAVGVKALVPESATIGASIGGRDIALLIVRSVDASFDKLKPRAIRKTPVRTGETLTGVGWGYASQAAKADRDTPLERTRREDVEVLRGSGQLEGLAVTLDGIDITVNNVQGEIITTTVACQGDSGGPAFDSAGAIAGVVSSMRGGRTGCVEGSITSYVDVSAFRSFIEASVGQTQQFSCLTDASCATSGAGRICDAATHACVQGCRVGGAGCGTGTCYAPSQAKGVIGTCTPPPPVGSPTTPPEPPPLEVDPGVDPPAPPVVTPAPATVECTVDTDCARSAQATEPKVCSRNACIAGCRLNAANNPCGAGRVCAASATDPSAGTCTAKPASGALPQTPTTAPAPVTAPAPIAAAPAAGAPSPNASDGSGAPTTTPKKKKAAASTDEAASGCSVGAARSESLGSLALFALAAIALRRRRAR